MKGYSKDYSRFIYPILAGCLLTFIVSFILAGTTVTPVLFNKLGWFVLFCVQIITITENWRSDRSEGIIEALYGRFSSLINFIFIKFIFSLFSNGVFISVIFLFGHFILGHPLSCATLPIKLSLWVLPLLSIINVTLGAILYDHPSSFVLTSFIALPLWLPLLIMTLISMELNELAPLIILLGISLILLPIFAYLTSKALLDR